MRLIRTIDKKQTWGVCYRTLPDGAIVIDTLHRYNAADFGAQRNGRTVVANLVVSAALRPRELTRQGRLFLRDRETCTSYPIVGQSILNLMTGILDGRIPVEEGYAVAQWTFVCRTGHVYLDLFDGAAAPEAAAPPSGAEDLSDFIKTLGREG